MGTLKIVIVTGANSGLGYEAIKAFLKAARPYHIFLGSRSIDKGNAALRQLREECKDVKNSVELLPIDLASDESIDKAYELLKSKHDCIDILVNNAGRHGGSHEVGLKY